MKTRMTSSQPEKDKEARHVERALQEALNAISKREAEITNSSLERRKEICEEIFNNAADSLEKPEHRLFIQQRKQEVLRKLERDYLG